MQTVAVGDGCPRGLLGCNCGPSGGATTVPVGEVGLGRGREHMETALSLSFFVNQELLFITVY